MWFKEASAGIAKEFSSHGLVLMKFMYRIKVTSPIILTNYSGHIMNAVFKRMLMSDDPLKYVIHISPLYTGNEIRYLLTSPTPLQPGIYGFSATTNFHTLEKMVNLVNQTYIELEGIECRIENIEFKPIHINLLKTSTCPEYFYLNFKTPTIMGKKPMSLRAKMKIYELLPLPTYVFGTLANTWNSIVGDESLKIDVRKYLEWVRKNMIVIPPSLRRHRIKDTSSGHKNYPAHHQR